MITWLKAEEQHQHKNGGGWVANTATTEDSVHIGPNAVVFGDARVFGDAWVFGNAQVYGKAVVSDNARVFGDVQVFGNAQVYGKAVVSGDAWVFGDAQVFGDAAVYGNARVFGDAWVFGDAQVFGKAVVFSDAWMETPLFIQGTKHGVSNSSYGKLSIGCVTLTFAEWKKQYRALGKREGYTEKQIKEYGAIIALATKIGK